MYTDKCKSPKSTTKPPSPEALQAISKVTLAPLKSPPKRSVSHGHETVVVYKPNKEHIQAFKEGLETPAPLNIIQHVKVGVKFPKMSSGNTSPSICRNHIGGFYASA